MAPAGAALVAIIAGGGRAAAALEEFNAADRAAGLAEARVEKVAEEVREEKAWRTKEGKKRKADAANIARIKRERADAAKAKLMGSVAEPLTREQAEVVVENMPRKLDSFQEWEVMQVVTQLKDSQSMRVLLIGDSCTDVYVYGDVKRLNPEAPVPILEPKREDSSKGMAWNVFDNLKAFGLSVFMLTNEEKIIKTRYIHEKSNQQILRVDNEPEIKPLPYEPPFITDRSAYHRPPHKAPPKEWYDVMVISDYNKGICNTREVI